MNEVREKIIHEAIKLFSTQGYHKTSMRDIMNAADALSRRYTITLKTSRRYFRKPC